MSPAFSLRTTIEPWGIEIERTFCLCKSVWLYFSARNFSWLLDHLSTTFNFQVNSCLLGCDHLTPVQNFSYSCPCGTWWLTHQRHTWVGKKKHIWGFSYHSFHGWRKKDIRQIHLDKVKMTQHHLEKLFKVKVFQELWASLF